MKKYYMSMVTILAFVFSSALVWAGEMQLPKGGATASISVGPAIGAKMFGSHEAHHMGVVQIGIAKILSGKVGKGKWYEGSFCVEGRIILAHQFQPDSASLAGAQLGFRYNFSPSSTFAPYVAIRSGPSDTDIGAPDLADTIQFITTPVLGFQFGQTEVSAWTLEFQAMHISNAGIRPPNSGVNAFLIMLGKRWSL